jgi:phage terminase large subunit GpA-like protein
MIGTDTAKDYLAARYHLTSGPGAIHFSAELPPEYYEQVTAEYCIAVYKRGRKVRVWDKKKNDRNEAGDLMVYNLACAHYLGLHKKTASQWQAVREFVDPDTRDLFQEPPAPSASQESAAPQASSPAPSPTAQPRQDPWQAQKPQSTTTRQRRPAGRQW